MKKNHTQKTGSEREGDISVVAFAKELIKAIENNTDITHSALDDQCTLNTQYIASELDALKSIIGYKTEEKLTTEISILWCADDVLSLDDTLTPEQVSEVLNLVERKWDADSGISWDTIQFWIDEVKGEDN